MMVWPGDEAHPNPMYDANYAHAKTYPIFYARYFMLLIVQPLILLDLFLVTGVGFSTKSFMWFSNSMMLLCWLAGAFVTHASRWGLCPDPPRPNRLKVPVCDDFFLALEAAYSFLIRDVMDSFLGIWLCVFVGRLHPDDRGAANCSRKERTCSAVRPDPHDEVVCDVHTLSASSTFADTSSACAANQAAVRAPHVRYAGGAVHFSMAVDPGRRIARIAVGSGRDCLCRNRLYNAVPIWDDAPSKCTRARGLGRRARRNARIAGRGTAQRRAVERERAGGKRGARERGGGGGGRARGGGGLKTLLRELLVKKNVS
jgi:hypothetical protein